MFEIRFMITDESYGGSYQPRMNIYIRGAGQNISDQNFELPLNNVKSNFDHIWDHAERMLRSHFKADENKDNRETNKELIEKLQELEDRLEDLEEENEILIEENAELKLMQKLE